MLLKITNKKREYKLPFYRNYRILSKDKGENLIF